MLEPAPFAHRAIIPLIIGGVLIAGGGVFLGVSTVQTSDAARWGAGAARDELLFSAGNNRVGGVMLMVTGGLSAALATFLFLYRPEAVSFSVTPLSGGAFVSLGWRAP